MIDPLIVKLFLLSIPGIIVVVGVAWLLYELY